MGIVPAKHIPLRPMRPQPSVHYCAWCGGIKTRTVRSCENCGGPEVDRSLSSPPQGGSGVVLPKKF